MTRNPFWVIFSDSSRKFFSPSRRTYSFKSNKLKRKIKHYLILVPWFVGGGSFQMTHELIRSLVKRNYSFSVMYTREPGSHIKNLEPYVYEIKHLGLSLNKNKNNTTVSSLTSEKKIKGVILIDIDPDSYFLLPFFRERSIKIINWLHFHIDTLAPYRHFITKMKSLVDQYVVVNNEMKKKLLSKDYMSGIGKVCVVRNGIDIYKFNPKYYTSADKLTIKKTFGIPKKTLIVSYISRFDDLKNPLGSVAIFEQIAREMQNVQLVMAGDGYLLEKTREKVEKLGLRKRVIFLNFQNDVRELLSVSTVLIAPSISESFGLSVAEAMTMEIPVVVSNVGGLRRLVVNGVNGYRVNVSDYDSFSKKTIYLLKNRSRARSFGKAGRRHILSNYPLDNMIDDFESLFTKISI